MKKLEEMFILFSFVFSFHCLFAENEKTRGTFIVFSFLFSFYFLFAGFRAFRDPGKQK